MCVCVRVCVCACVCTCACACGSSLPKEPGLLGPRSAWHGRGHGRLFPAGTWPAWSASPNPFSLSKVETKHPLGPLSACWQGQPKDKVTSLHLSKFRANSEGEGRTGGHDNDKKTAVGTVATTAQPAPAHLPSRLPGEDRGRVSLRRPARGHRAGTRLPPSPQPHPVRFQNSPLEITAC